MNDYDLLGLMDTHKAMKAQGIDIPDNFQEFITHIQPIDEREVAQSYTGLDGGEDPITRLVRQQKRAEFDASYETQTLDDAKHTKNPGYDYQSPENGIGPSKPSPSLPYIPGTADRMPVVPSNADYSGYSTLS